MTAAAVPSEFGLHINDGDGRIVVAVSGELDILTAPELASALADAVARRPTAIVVDATAITFADSTALSVLLSAHRSSTAADVPMAVRPSTPLNRILELTGLHNVLVLPD